MFMFSKNADWPMLFQSHSWRHCGRFCWTWTSCSLSMKSSSQQPLTKVTVSYHNEPII